MSDVASDSLLLEALRNGDERSFEEIFVRHRGQVYGVAFRLLGSREEAEELTQEVFLKLYRHRFASREDHNLLAWLYKVATNLSFNSLRSRRRQRERMEKTAVLETGDSASEDPQEEVMRMEEREAVRAVIDMLPESQRVCLVLRQMGLSYAEIAPIAGVAPGSVGTLLARAERNFKERYLALQRKEM